LGTGAPFSSNSLITHQPHAISLFSPVDYKEKNTRRGGKTKAIVKPIYNLKPAVQEKFNEVYGSAKRKDEKSWV
jgi:hypothetical protein